MMVRVVLIKKKLVDFNEPMTEGKMTTCVINVSKNETRNTMGSRDNKDGARKALDHGTSCPEGGMVATSIVKPGVAMIIPSNDTKDCHSVNSTYEGQACIRRWIK